MNISFERKEIITKVSLQIELKDAEIQAFKDILTMAQNEMFTRRTYYNFKLENSIVEDLQKILK